MSLALIAKLYSLEEDCSFASGEVGDEDVKQSSIGTPSDVDFGGVEANATEGTLRYGGEVKPEVKIELYQSSISEVREGASSSGLYFSPFSQVGLENDDEADGNRRHGKNHSRRSCGKAEKRMQKPDDSSYEDQRRRKARIPSKNRRRSHHPISSLPEEEANKIQKLFKCPFCLSNFSEADELIQHLPTHDYKDSHAKKTGESAKRFRKKELERTTPTELPPCKVVLFRCDQLISNLNQRELAKDSDLTSRKVSPAKSQKKKSFSCPVCHKMFTTRGGLKLHENVHTGRRPHRCQICLKTFTQLGSLQLHMRIHTEEKPHKCPICQKAFGQSCYIKIHMRQHTGERPYRCLHCGDTFTQKENLKTHVRTHTGEKPFKCERCGRAFLTSSNRKAHWGSRNCTGRTTGRKLAA